MQASSHAVAVLARRAHRTLPHRPLRRAAVDPFAPLVVGVVAVELPVRRVRFAPLEVVDSVGTGHLTVPTADADVVVREHQSVLLARVAGADRTDLLAGRVRAVLARLHQEVLVVLPLVLVREDVHPVGPAGGVVLLLAGDHAGETAVAVVEVDHHPQLLPLAPVVADGRRAVPTARRKAERERRGGRAALLHHLASREVAVFGQPRERREGAPAVRVVRSVGRRVDVERLRQQLDAPVVDAELLDDGVGVSFVERFLRYLARGEPLGVPRHLEAEFGVELRLVEQAFHAPSPGVVVRNDRRIVTGHVVCVIKGRW